MMMILHCWCSYRNHYVDLQYELQEGRCLGQPVAVVFGITLIACGIWAIVLNAKATREPRRRVRYQEIRAEKLGAYLKQNSRQEIRS